MKFKINRQVYNQVQDKLAHLKDLLLCSSLFDVFLRQKLLQAERNEIHIQSEKISNNTLNWNWHYSYTIRIQYLNALSTFHSSLLSSLPEWTIWSLQYLDFTHHFMAFNNAAPLIMKQRGSKHCVLWLKVLGFGLTPEIQACVYVLYEARTGSVFEFHQIHKPCQMTRDENHSGCRHAPGETHAGWHICYQSL